jgi:mono/diheme cytochrome c family protein
MKVSPRSGARPIAAALLLVLLVSLSGCGKSDPAPFRANLALYEAFREDEPELRKDDEDPEKDEKPEVFKKRLEAYKAEDDRWKECQQATINYVEGIFGTPDSPRAIPETGLDKQKLLLASGPVKIDGIGKQQGLYRRHCVHCHGITGDGMGPTAFFLNPYPRDFRRGWFKFKSTELKAKPTTVSTFEIEDGNVHEIPNDLKRVLIEGIPGTAMPSFRTLADDELNALIEYVKYLSMRGQMEEMLFRRLYDEAESAESFSPDQLDQLLSPLIVLGEEMLGDIVGQWEEASAKIINPPPPPKKDLALSIKDGHDLFFNLTKATGDKPAPKANCFTCHGREALGDGTMEPDNWNKEYVKLKKKKYERFVAAGYILPPERKNPPRNLRQGVFRGGRRPLDIYRRIHTGINGTAMPGSSTNLTPEQIWDLVHFVRNLQYEPVSGTGKTSNLPTNERLRN